MRIAITGAGGFLGTEILKQLAKIDAVDVVAFSGQSSLQVSESLAGRLTLLPREAACDSLSYEAVDVIINCAFPRTNDGASLASGMDYLDRLFSAIGGSGVRALVNVSSQSVYDPQRTNGATESEPLCLSGEYAVAKYASELLVDARCSSVPHTHIRLASLIGAGFDQRVLNKLVKKALSGQNIVIRDNGYRYGYLDVRDAANAIIVLAESDAQAWRSIYNIGPVESCTLTDMITAVCQYSFDALNLHVEYCCDDVSVDVLGACSALDSSLFKSQFGWSPSFGLGQTVRDIFEYEIAKQEVAT